MVWSYAFPGGVVPRKTPMGAVAEAPAWNTADATGGDRS